MLCKVKMSIFYEHWQSEESVVGSLALSNVDSSFGLLSWSWREVRLLQTTSISIYALTSNTLVHSEGKKTLVNTHNLFSNVCLTEKLSPGITFLVKLPQSCTIEISELIKIRIASHDEGVPNKYIWTSFAFAPDPGLIHHFFIETLSHLFPVLNCV